MDLGTKRARLEAILREARGAAVALSGGVDSSLLLAEAVRVLGGARVVAVTGRSEAVPEEDLADAERVAAHVGVAHVVVDTAETRDPGYLRNAPDRCYRCKSELFDRVRAVAAERGLDAVWDGTIADDLGEFRPGLRAGRERGVGSPLAEAGLTKDEVRALSRAHGLPTADRPASPCLSSRFPHGTPITVEGLRRVARAEGALRALGFRVLRVRAHGDLARIEVPLDDLPRLLGDPTRTRVERAVLAAGFDRVEVDRRGFRSGSLVEGLRRRAPERRA